MVTMFPASFHAYVMGVAFASPSTRVMAASVLAASMGWLNAMVMGASRSMGCVPGGRTSITRGMVVVKDQSGTSVRLVPAVLVSSGLISTR